MILQQGDVKLFQTLDDGEITVSDGVTEMTAGLETAVYLSLFGGNEEDNGQDGNALQWWGNLTENEAQYMYRSETQYMLQSLPITTANLERLKKAIANDIDWAAEADLAKAPEIILTIPGINRIDIRIDFRIGDDVSTFYYEFYKDEVAT